MSGERILLAELDSAVWDRLEPALGAFEEAWKRGQSPAIADYLPAEPNERTAMLVELVNLDLEYRLKAGAHVRVESYLRHYPELAHARDQLLALIEAEYRLRSRSEPNVTPAEFLERFPAYRQDLGDRLGRQTAADTNRSIATRADQPSVASPAVEGLTIPNYEILGEQGRGSMGVVYRAQQQTPRRLVALKMILAGPHADFQQRQRFRNEADVLARLRHPNIVQIYEVGEHDGRPFLALEFVDGGTLASRLAGTPLPSADAARLVQTLAQAVQAAHQLGIVHRDLKPANILLQMGNAEGGMGKEDKESSLDGVGRPLCSFPIPHSPFPIAKITDFGLAKQLLGEPGQTRSGAVVGTPSYMAPEQARGDAKHVGPSTDVYALGAILYELLTGRPPFKGASAMDTMLQVLDDDVVPPSRLQGKTPRDLETICLKCLQKRPDKRYETAQALADDLERFLTNRPILARPTRWPERIGKWAQREPKAAALTGGIIAIALAAFGLVTWQWQRAETARGKAVGLAKAEAKAKQDAQDNAKEARDNAKEAVVQRDKAREHFRLARTAVDKFYTQVSESPEMKARGAEELRTKLLETAAEFYRQFTEKAEGNDPEIRAEQAKGMQRLGALYGAIGRNKEAEKAYRQAVNMFAKLLADYPRNGQYQHQQGITLLELGELFLAIGHRLREAEELFQQALTIDKRLVAAQPDIPDYRTYLGASHSCLGGLYLIEGRWWEAEKAFQEQLPHCQKLTRDHPTVPIYWVRLAGCYGSLSELYDTLGRSSEALRMREQSLAACKKVASDHPGNDEYRWPLAASQLSIAILYSDAGRTEEAEDTCRQALKVIQDVATKHPRVAVYQILLAKANKCLGNLYFHIAGRAKETEEAYQEAMAIYQRLVGDEPRNPSYRGFLAGAYNGLGDVYRTTGRSKEGEDAYRQARGIFAKLVANHPDLTGCGVGLGHANVGLAKLLEGSGRRAEILEACGQAIAILPAVLEKKPNGTARSYLRDAHWRRASTLRELGRHADAARDLVQAIKFDSGSNRPYFQAQLARALAQSGDHAAGLAEAEKLERLLKQTTHDPTNGGPWYGLALVYSVAVTAVGKDDRMADAERAKLTDRYAMKALGFLHQAKAMGFFYNPGILANMKKDPTFDPLRNRPDFKKLLAELEPPAKTSKP